MPTLRSTGSLLNSHRAITRVSLAALTFAFLFGVSQQEPTQAGPAEAPLTPQSLLPQPVGVAIATNAPVTIPFDQAMDPASVANALRLFPDVPVQVSWNAERTALRLAPDGGWSTGQRYLLVVGGGTTAADGTVRAESRRYAFSTEPAPAVNDFQLRLAAADLVSTDSPAVAHDLLADEETELRATPNLSPTATARDVSAGTTISVGFSRAMNRTDVARRFAITPAIDGSLSWSGTNLVFSPRERLAPGMRYTISVIGAHDLRGNVLAGKANFSFLVQPGAQLMQASPALEAADVEPASIGAWFSQPMDVAAMGSGFAVVDVTAGEPIAGAITWNEPRTHLTFTPRATFAKGHRFEVRVGSGARDADGNAVSRTWSFTTKSPPPPPAPAPVTTRVVLPAPAPAATLQGYALNQVNAARAAYGFAPLVLDASISAVASAHAWDQARNGYFSHYSQDGRTRQDRLIAGGVSFSASGENQCYLVGSSLQATLNWCHSAFMAEAYPGQPNHIANVLSPNFHRMGVGIATAGAKVIVTWNFTN